MLRAELDGLRTFTRRNAIELCKQLTLAKAVVISLAPSADPMPHQKLDFVTSPAEPHERPIVGDPAEASRPARAVIAPELPGVSTRQLPNGLAVVLLPISSLPTIDIRLVFGSGTSDEPSDKRGVALLASRTLRWDMRYVKDLLLFATAGGTPAVSVDTDHTTFSVNGIDSQLDYLLAGLRRWVREGRYDESVDAFVRNVKREHAKRDERTALTDAWRDARFGTGHPYAQAGLMRDASGELTDADAVQFRSAHYTPDNATLIIAGRFDPALVNRWIDYLFAEWAGHAAARDNPPVRPRATAVAVVAETAQVELELALPSGGTERAGQLVAAQMLHEIASDVRQQLGASYDLGASLAEQRLAKTYVMTGAVDATRAGAAMKRLAEDVDRLHRDRDYVSRVFVAARDHVLAALAFHGSARDVANRVEHDIELGRVAMSDRAMLSAVRDLTIEQMPAALDELDLSRAAIAMRGPAEGVRAAFEALGRKPTVLTPPSTPPYEEEAPRVRPHIDTTPHELADPLTDPGSRVRIAWALAAGFSYAAIEHDTATSDFHGSYSGPRVSGDVAVRSGRAFRGGLRVGFEQLSETRDNTNLMYSFTAFDIAPYAQLQLSGPFWAGAVAGLHIEDGGKRELGPMFGAELGMDLVPIAHHWFSAVVRYEFVFRLGRPLRPGHRGPHVWAMIGVP